MAKELEALADAKVRDIRRGINIRYEVRLYERALILRALKLAGGNQTHAARLLGLRVQTLNEKLKRYGMRDDV